MKKSELEKIIKETLKEIKVESRKIKDPLLEGETSVFYKGKCYCQTTHGYSVIITDCNKEICKACCRFHEVIGPDEKTGLDNNGMPFNTKTKTYIKDEASFAYNQNLREEEKVNSCANRNICCQERYTKNNISAFVQNGVCVCPKGSRQINCPR